ncbi:MULTISPECIES: DUF6093 family protein [unclassified Streptomyces]|uniref:DUF6093 family protein n=1 Tax=unclassified Streptomyces TaxID=2593676 RepID=UPI000805BC8C|nr:MULTISPECIES: DUF6093 family protein [unclassified Streptomyces]MYR75173.1 hypothetical protein [Streptomyces sp. SID4925]SBU98090.1 hypothetical protein YUMDRAFT_06048 [Streptomyces sp. OspMP-M45]
MAGLDGALAGVVAWVENNICIDTVRVTLPATGDPVFNPDTGELDYPDDQVLYEGPGAVQGSSAQELSATPGALTPWVQETTSRYRLLTPLNAHIPPKDAIVTVVAVHDPARTGLLGRSWTSQDPGRAGTVEVVRITPLDQNQAAAAGGAP